MKIIFMGTPDFSVGTLRALHAAGHEIVLAVTQPDKPRGRSKKPAYSPVKEEALRMDIPVWQPERIRNPECTDYLQSFAPDVIVVVAFGQILPKSILDLPRYGCVNVHASLLPKYRGAAPIQWAVLNGDAVTGVTKMQMDEGMDTGDILLTEEVALDARETGGSLFDRLAETGAALAVRTLVVLEAGSVTPVPQDADAATYTRMIKKEDGRIDFAESARAIECRIRAMNPWPSAYTKLGNKTLKLWEAEVLSEAGGAGAPGEIRTVDKTSFTVQTGDGLLRIKEVQLEGKKRMACGAFLRGYDLQPGTMLGGECE